MVARPLFRNADVQGAPRIGAVCQIELRLSELGAQNGFADLVNLRFKFRRRLAETMTVAGTAGAALANDGRVGGRTLFDPANIQDLADALKLLARFRGNRGGAATTVAARFDHVDRAFGVDVLCHERGRKIDAGAQDVWIACGILAAYRLAAIQSLVIAASQYRYL